MIDIFLIVYYIINDYEIYVYEHLVVYPDVSDIYFFMGAKPKSIIFKNILYLLFNFI